MRQHVEASRDPVLMTRARSTATVWEHLTEHFEPAVTAAVEPPGKAGWDEVSLVPDRIHRWERSATSRGT
jgi:hypothetical protein